MSDIPAIIIDDDGEDAIYSLNLNAKDAIDADNKRQRILDAVNLEGRCRRFLVWFSERWAKNPNLERPNPDVLMLVFKSAVLEGKIDDMFKGNPVEPELQTIIGELD